MPQQNPENLIWIDLEMTGLDPMEDRIIEIATIVTDKNLKVLEEGPTLAVKQSDEMLEGMDDWCTTQHGKSGLTDRQEALLTQWGYPYVMEEFRFHITLTGALDPAHLDAT